MTTKDEIRHEIRVKRAGLTLDWIDTNSKAAIKRLRDLDVLKETGNLACYLAKPFEVQTQRFIEGCLSEGKRVCVPRRVDDQPGYAWSWVAPAAAWRDGPWRVAEPAQYDAAEDHSIDLAIVPAVAVTRDGRRLGHGGGNFDRLLANLNCPRIALVFDFQVFDEVLTEAHDVPVHFIVTEADTYAVRD